MNTDQAKEKKDKMNWERSVSFYELHPKELSKYLKCTHNLCELFSRSSWSTAVRINSYNIVHKTA